MLIYNNYYFNIVSNCRKRKTEFSCQENLFTFFKYLADFVQMLQHYYWTQQGNHLCLKTSFMGWWGNSNGRGGDNEIPFGIACDCYLGRFSSNKGQTIIFLEGGWDIFLITLQTAFGKDEYSVKQTSKILNQSKRFIIYTLYNIFI